MSFTSLVRGHTESMILEMTESKNSRRNLVKADQELAAGLQTEDLVRHSKSRNLLPGCCHQAGSAVILNTMIGIKTRWAVQHGEGTQHAAESGTLLGTATSIGVARTNHKLVMVMISKHRTTRNQQTKSSSTDAGDGK